ncbi:hypothetical protein CAXC1_110016 [Candidatus Xenohaliotis californiensis]|uniref:Uncharacterized protein n=1 Tax=Candidatus Xenohaliotis californiensis TaxID=84677 RepID=A0ABM9N701_9RICK|nr:hypothetical protein CAXC1_110016 [Candidatus Xenohaliotis californiensis]
MIILAIRNDLDIPFIFPKEKDYLITVGEALVGCLPSIGKNIQQKKGGIENGTTRWVLERFTNRIPKRIHEGNLSYW